LTQEFEDNNQHLSPIPIISTASLTSGVKTRSQTSASLIASSRIPVVEKKSTGLEPLIHVINQRLTTTGPMSVIDNAIMDIVVESAKAVSEDDDEGEEKGDEEESEGEDTSKEIIPTLTKERLNRRETLSKGGWVRPSKNK